MLAFSVSYSDDLKDVRLRFHWQNVSIRDYDVDKQLWLVAIDDKEHDTFDMYRPAKRTRQQTQTIDGKSQSIDCHRQFIGIVDELFVRVS
jgi:hypothetical protein